jgi:hypothetical protein
MTIRQMMTIALFMLAAFFGLQALAAPEWAAVLVSVAVGQFLWSKERRRTAREIHSAWLSQMMTSQALILEMKFTAAMEKLEKSSVESADSRIEREAEPNTQLI